MKVFKTIILFTFIAIIMVGCTKKSKITRTTNLSQADNNLYDSISAKIGLGLLSEDGEMRIWNGFDSIFPSSVLVIKKDHRTTFMSFIFIDIEKMLQQTGSNSMKNVKLDKLVFDRFDFDQNPELTWLSDSLLTDGNLDTLKFQPAEVRERISIRPISGRVSSTIFELRKRDINKRFLFFEPYSLSSDDPNTKRMADLLILFEQRFFRLPQFRTWISKYL